MQLFYFEKPILRALPVCDFLSEWICSVQFRFLCLTSLVDPDWENESPVVVQTFLTPRGRTLLVDGLFSEGHILGFD